MKKIIFVLLLISFLYISNAQDKEPEPFLFNFSGSTTAPLPQIPQSKFHLDFEWDEPGKMHNELFMYHKIPLFDLNSIRHIPSAIPNSSGSYDITFKGSGYFVGYINCPALQFEPVLDYSTSTENEFNQDPNDDSKGIFGFKYRLGNKLYTTESGIKTARIQLLKNNFPWSPTGFMVLTDNYPDDLPYYHGGWDGEPKYGIQHNANVTTTGGYDGVNWNISINLKRDGLTDFGALHNATENTDKVIGIRIKTYTSNYKDNLRLTPPTWNNDFITFDSLPQKDVSNISNIEYLPSGRGFAMENELAPPSTKEFIIYKSMLPNLQDDINNIGPNITLSAHFTCDNGYRHVKDFPLDNYYLQMDENNVERVAVDKKPKDGKYDITDINDRRGPITNLQLYPGNKNGDANNQTVISKLIIEVVYYGNCDVAIDWIRLENDSAKKLFRGYFDTDGQLEDCGAGDILCYKRGQIKEIVQSNIDQLCPAPTTDAHFPDYTNCDCRFRGQVETGYHFLHAHRYINRVLNGRLAPIFGEYSKWYAYHVDYQTRYLQMKVAGVTEAFTANPFVKRAIQGPNYCGYKYGYDDNDNHPWHIDNPNYDPAIEAQNDLWKFSSVYETFLSLRSKFTEPISYLLLPTPDIDSYLNMIFAKSYFQSQWEANIYHFFYNSKTNAFLYDDRPWWMNFLSSGIFAHNDTKFNSVYLRPKTGPELSLGIYTCLVFGSQGLTYDGERSNSLHIADLMTHTGLRNDESPNLSGTTGWDYLDQDVLGSDFITVGDDDFSLFGKHLTIEQTRYMGINPDRFYTGRRTNRSVLRKLHEYIKNNEEELMKLKLVAAYSKGYAVFENNDKYYPNDILHNFILLPQNANNFTIKTRPINRVDANGVPDYENDNPCNHTYIHNYVSPISSTPIPDTVTITNIDSAFYDITLLRDISIDRPPEYSAFNNYEPSKYPEELKKFYLGVINKRTDPLIPESEDIYNDAVFYSESEFDDFVRYGGKSQLFNSYLDKEYWVSKWWKRQGAREITIPLNYFNNSYRLHITEVGGKNPILNALWYRNPVLYHNIDTTLLSGQKLVVNLLPGNGKILKCEFEKYDILSCCDDIEAEFVDAGGGSLNQCCKKLKITIKPRNDHNSCPPPSFFLTDSKNNTYHIYASQNNIYYSGIICLDAATPEVFTLLSDIGAINCVKTIPYICNAKSCCDETRAEVLQSICAPSTTESLCDFNVVVNTACTQDWKIDYYEFTENAHHYEYRFWSPSSISQLETTVITQNSPILFRNNMTVGKYNYTIRVHYVSNNPNTPNESFDCYTQASWDCLEPICGKLGAPKLNSVNGNNENCCYNLFIPTLFKQPVTNFSKIKIKEFTSATSFTLDTITSSGFVFDSTNGGYTLNKQFCGNSNTGLIHLEVSYIDTEGKEWTECKHDVKQSYVCDCCSGLSVNLVNNGSSASSNGVLCCNYLLNVVKLPVNMCDVYTFTVFDKTNNRTLSYRNNNNKINFNNSSTSGRTFTATELGTLYVCPPQCSACTSSDTLDIEVAFYGKTGNELCRLSKSANCNVVYGTAVDKSPEIDDKLNKGKNNNNGLLKNCTIVPNPAQNEISVEFELESNYELSIDLFSSIGDNLMNFGKKTYKAGKNSFKINTRDLPNGNYYIRLYSNEIDRSMPFVILK